MDREGRGRRQGCITGIALQRSVEPGAAQCGIAGAQAQMISHRRLGVFACVRVFVDDSRIVLLHLVHLSTVCMGWRVCVCRVVDAEGRRQDLGEAAASRRALT